MTFLSSSEETLRFPSDRRGCRLTGHEGTLHTPALRGFQAPYRQATSLELAARLNYKPGAIVNCKWEGLDASQQPVLSLGLGHFKAEHHQLLLLRVMTAIPHRQGEPVSAHSVFSTDGKQSLLCC